METLKPQASILKPKSSKHTQGMWGVEEYRPLTVLPPPAEHALLLMSDIDGTLIGGLLSLCLSVSLPSSISFLSLYLFSLSLSLSPPRHPHSPPPPLSSLSLSPSLRLRGVTCRQIPKP
jgi:hypothetical protein